MIKNPSEQIKKSFVSSIMNLKNKAVTKAIHTFNKAFFCPKIEKIC
jgi:hypothetical protein